MVSQGITNWMGDDVFLIPVLRIRRFNVYGDIQFIKGKITKKYELTGNIWLTWMPGRKPARRSDRTRESCRSLPIKSGKEK